MATEEVLEVVKHPLDMEHVSSSLWLVKVPTFVAERWATAKSDELVGSLSAAKTSAGTNILNVKLANGASEAPLEFTLDEFPISKDQHLMAFSNVAEDNSFKMVGQVTKKLILKPKDTLPYRHLISERSKVASSGHTVKMTSENSLLTRDGESDMTSRLVDFIPPSFAVLKRKKLDGGRSSKSLSPGEEKKLVARVLDYWAKVGVDTRIKKKEILTICHDMECSPEAISAVLSKYATAIRSGPNKGCWELNKEYKSLDQVALTAAIEAKAGGGSAGDEGKKRKLE